MYFVLPSFSVCQGDFPFFVVCFQGCALILVRVHRTFLQGFGPPLFPAFFRSCPPCPSWNCTDLHEVSNQSSKSVRGGRYFPFRSGPPFSKMLFHYTLCFCSSFFLSLIFEFCFCFMSHHDERPCVVIRRSPETIALRQGL